MRPQEPAILLALMSIGGSILGCAEHFMPLGDDRFMLQFVMPARDKDGGLQAMVCPPEGGPCGRRNAEAEGYDPDVLRFEVESRAFDTQFSVGGKGNGRIEPGIFRVSGIDVDPKSPANIYYFNDFSGLVLDIPPRFQITFPTDEQPLKRSSTEGLRVEWAPMSPAFPIHWRFFPVNNEPEDLLPCDTLSWGTFEGEGEDLGVLEIPPDVIPSDLPPQGCLVAFSVDRSMALELPEGMHGLANSTVLNGVVFRVTP